MRKINYLKHLFLLYLSIHFCNCFTQQEAKITNVRIENIENQELVITYSLIEQEAKNLYNIWIEVTDSKGNNLNVYSLAGDVGKNIKAGINNQITWNLVEDKILIDDDVYIEVKAIPLKEVSKFVMPSGKLLFPSLVLPGYGNTKISNGKPFWISSVGAYSMVGASIVLNRVATNKYENYTKDSNASREENDKLYQQATNLDMTSKILAYAGGAIVISDIICLFIQSSKKERDTANLSKTSRFDYSISQRAGIPIIGLSWNF